VVIKIVRGANTQKELFKEVSTLVTKGSIDRVWLIRSKGLNDHKVALYLE